MPSSIGVNADVDNERCPRCAALVRHGSQWCTLCYADLRPAPVPPPLQAVSPPASGTVAGVVNDIATRGATAGEAFDPLTAPLALLERVSGEPLSDRASYDESPAESPAVTKTAYWPCLRCGANVTIEESACTSCGAGFLESAADPAVAIRGFSFGSEGPSKQTKVLIMVGGSFGLLIVLLGLMYLVGTVF